MNVIHFPDLDEPSDGMFLNGRNPAEQEALNRKEDGNFFVLLQNDHSGAGSCYNFI